MLRSSTSLSTARLCGIKPALTRSIITTPTTCSPTLLAHSRRQVDLANSKASDQLGDVMAKRWLGGAGAKGTDTDRVSWEDS